MIRWIIDQLQQPPSPRSRIIETSKSNFSTVRLSFDRAYTTHAHWRTRGNFLSTLTAALTRVSSWMSDGRNQRSDDIFIYIWRLKVSFARVRRHSFPNHNKTRRTGHNTRGRYYIALCCIHTLVYTVQYIIEAEASGARCARAEVRRVNAASRARALRQKCVFPRARSQWRAPPPPPPSTVHIYRYMCV